MRRVLRRTALGLAVPLAVAVGCVSGPGEDSERGAAARDDQAAGHEHEATPPASSPRKSDQRRPSTERPEPDAICVDNGTGLGTGSGADGAYVPVASATFPQTATKVTSGTAGSTTLTVASSTGFVAGNLVLVHQTQGANAGTWEIEQVTATTATTLTFALALQNSYVSDATDAAQAVKVPQYTTVTIAAGVTITAPAWNGTTGGLLPFLATGAVTVAGTLQATGTGYRGGVGDGGGNTCPGTPKAGFQGESSVGAGARSTAANGEGGGGGGTLATFCCSNCPPTPNTTGDSGGGGGGYGVAGTAGEGSAAVGAGGGTVGPTSLASIYFGGGGGAGGGNCTVSSPPGGPGGGAIIISAGSLTLAATGTLASNGVTPGINGAMNWEGAGGGGAGGAIMISAQTVTAAANRMTATGAAGAEQCAGEGGNGGAGRIRVACGTVNGAACGSAAGTFSSPAAVVGTFCSFATCTSSAECTTPPGFCSPTTHACETCTGNFGSTTAEPCPTAALPVCLTSGASAGECVQCAANADCTGNANGTICDTTKNTCGTCTSTSFAACTGATPVCNTGGTNDKCAACTGNNGAVTAEPCPTTTAPLCLLTGANAGSCVQCTSSANCVGNPNGPICDTTKDTCGTCAAGNTGACVGTTPICNTSGTDDTCVACTGNNGTVTAEPCPTTTAPACVLTGTNAGACVQCTTSANCTTSADPVCNTTTNTCVPCNGDNGSGATNACPSSSAPYCTPVTGTCGTCTNDASCTTGTHNGPICNPTTGACGTSCFSDTDCGAGWCNNIPGPGVCEPKIANGGSLPIACTAISGARACVTGVCDPNGNVCGIQEGDATCASTLQCIAGLCIATGPKTGFCEPCATDLNCASPTPVCSQTTNTCVQCATGDSAACTGATPICGPSDACVGCNGDNGSSATEPCPTAGLPACVLTGTNAGACVQCVQDTDCTGNASGPICDTTKNTCGTCSPTEGAACAGSTPVCNTSGANDTCAACTGDHGTTTAQPCPTAGAPACVLTGSSAGACVQCVGDGDCVGNANGTLCDTTKDTCGTCTPTDASACTGGTPVCNTSGANDTCAACTGNNGAATAEPCPTTALPICLLSGASAGTCAQCGASTDCTTALAPVCDGTSNTCVACNGDHGSGARDACPTPGNPYCESTGACGQCTSSTQCTTGTHDGPFCNTTTGACGAGPDAGAPDAGSDGGAADGSAGGDGGPTDAAADATSPEDSGLTDASSPPEDSGSDAAVAADATASGGSIAGGGCSCDAVGASRDGPSRAGGFAALVGLGFFASRRRRKSGGG